MSTVVPTYNRVDEVLFAVRSALAQSYPNQEVIVVDDGSTDATAEVLAAEFGDAISVHHQPNRGVAVARNVGVARARGDYIAFLDSDDEWLPDKLAAQVAFLEFHPGFAMVLTDIVRMDVRRRAMQIVRRREAIPEDGHVLHHIVRSPGLAPSTVMITRRAWLRVGGFDTSLRTAEDIDFHLRLAVDHKIGVIDRPLTRCMRGHDGLSSLSRTWHDHLAVVERFVAKHRELLDERDVRAALYNAHLPNARGLIWDGQYLAAARVAGKGLGYASGAREVAGIGSLAPLLVRNLAAQGLRKLRAALR